MALFCGVVAIALWSTLALLTVSTRALPVYQTLAISFLVAGLFGVLYALRSGGVAALRHPLAATALATFALFAYHALYFMAFRRAPAVEVNLINYLWPVLIVLFAALLTRHRPTPQAWIATLLGLAAVFLVISRGQGIRIAPEYAAGFALALGAAVLWALYSVLNRRFGEVPSTALALPCLFSGLAYAGVHAASESWVAPTATQWAILLVIGIGPTGIAFFLWDYATKHAPIVQLGNLSVATPVLSTLWLVLAGHAAPHWTQALALSLLALAVWLGARGQRPEPSP